MREYTAWELLITSIILFLVFTSIFAIYDQMKRLEDVQEELIESVVNLPI